MSFLVGDDWIEAPAGTFIRVPAGMTHDFRNRGGRARHRVQRLHPRRVRGRVRVLVIRPAVMRTYVRVTARDPHRGFAARRRRAQRLRDLPPARCRLAPPCATGAGRDTSEGPPCSTCSRCGSGADRDRAPSDYAELLGLYLGDGHIAPLARTQRLRIFLDARNRRSSARPRRCCADASRPTASAACSPTEARSCSGLQQAPDVPVPAARRRQEARASDRPRGLAAVARRRGAVGVPPRLHPVGRLRLRQPDRALRVPELRLHEPLDGHPRLVRADVPGGRAAPTALRAIASGSTAARTWPGWSSMSASSLDAPTR